MNVSIRSVICLAIFLTGALTVRAEECEKILDGRPLELNLPDYRSPQLAELHKRISAVNKEIDEIDMKLESNGKSSLFGFTVRRARTDHADNEAGELRKTISVLKGEKASLRKSIQVAKEENRQALINVYREQRDQSEFTKYFNDYRQIINFSRLRGREVIPVLVGSRDRAPTEQEIEAYTELVSQLVARNYTIVYDADNQASSYIAAAAGAKGIGITMSAEPPTLQPTFQSEGITVRFNNPYSFIEVLRDSWAPIVSPENLLGQAALIDNAAGFVLDLRPEGDVRNGLFDWYQNLNTSDEGKEKEEKKNNNKFGISFHKLGIYRSIDSLLKASYGKEGSKKKKFVFSQIHEPKNSLKFFNVPAKKLSYEEIAHLLEYRDIMIAGQEKLANIRGAAIFGTSQLDESVADETYDLGHWLGRRDIPVITGGAGGVMYAANMGAYDAGGESIGIPLVGRGLLDYETEIHNEVQSRTIPALDYNARIPLLLNNRDFIFIEPGGMGTLRELAASLVYLQYSDARPFIIVVGQYYQPLQKFLKSLELSPTLQDHIIFRDDLPSTLVTAIELTNTPNNNYEAYGTIDTIKPRSNRMQFPKEEIEKAKDEE